MCLRNWNLNLLWNRDAHSWLRERHSCLLEGSGFELGWCGHCPHCCSEGSPSLSASCCFLSFPYPIFPYFTLQYFTLLLGKKYFELWGKTLCTKSLLLSSKSWLTPPSGAERFGAGWPGRQSWFFSMRYLRVSWAVVWGIFLALTGFKGFGQGEHWSVHSPHNRNQSDLQVLASEFDKILG